MMGAMDVYRKALELVAEGRSFALAAVIHSLGSTPQKAGAKALFEAEGPVWGTLGGGCLEAESRVRALHALDTDSATAFDLRLDDIDGWDDGLICGGRVRVLALPSIVANLPVYERALAAATANEAGLLVTVVAHPSYPLGTAFWIDEAQIPTDPLLASCGDEVLSCFAAGRARTLARPEKDIELFLEPVLPAPRLLIAGGGHIGQAVARFAHESGFRVTVVDDRPAFAAPARFPGAETICGDIPETMAQLPMDSRTYVLIVTRGHRHDGKVLAACIHKTTAFIGMIGSRRKSLLIRRRIVEEGLATAEEAARVVSPVGLDIGAESVTEIALSIMAQLIAHRRRATLDGPSMQTALDLDRAAPDLACET